jgi:uncharacterized MAPEG superfamily protein
MSALATALGLHAGHGIPVANYAPYHAMFNFIWAHIITSSRALKLRYGLDHNVNPREDVARFGEKAVQDGKITRQQLNRLKRNEAAHANAIEHYPVFVACILFATVSKVPNETINRACAIYSIARIVHTIAYVSVDKWKHSWIRSLAWWISNFSCIYLFWQSGKTLV